VSTPTPATTSVTNAVLVTYAHTMYALHAVSIATGVVTTALGYRTILFGVPSVAAIFMNLLRRPQVRGTRLQSHFDWQARTIAWLLAGIAVASLAFGSIVLVLTRVPLLEISFLLLGVWAGIRIARGWVALREARTITAHGIF
jgi:uncharacterized membrane protein